jgi:hypothetical protein
VTESQLAKLASAGMSTQIHDRDGDHHGVHTLTMPPHHVTSTHATEPGS